MMFMAVLTESPEEGSAMSLPPQPLSSGLQRLPR
jgi:hypothetical protein